MAGAELHLLYQVDGEGSGQYYQWDNSLYGLGKSTADGAFVVNQLRDGLHYYLGISAPGYASLMLTNVSTGISPLTIRLGPELIVHGHVLGTLDDSMKYGNDHVLTMDTTEVYGNNSYGFNQIVPVRATNGVATFQFTNHVAGQVTLTGGGYREERDVNAPIADWVVDLTGPQQTAAKIALKREVIFRFQSASGVSPVGTVTVNITDGINNLTARDVEMPISNGEVRTAIPVGAMTTIQPKRMAGFWFDYARLGNDGQMFINVTNGPGPQIVNIPLIPAGSIFARARNADGTLAGGLMFTLDELKRAPSRPDDDPLSDNADGFSDNAPRKWVSGALPLGGTYRVDAWRGNSFCVSHPIKLTEANPDAEVELQFPPGQTFSGIILGLDGKPLRGAELKTVFTLAGTHGFDLKSVYTDDEGRFQLENMTPTLGTYAVEADAPQIMAERVKLDFNSRPQIIRLRRGRTLAGRVVEAGTGYAIPGAEVRVVDYERSELPMQTTRTDADGRFEFNTLGDGDYSFYFSDAQLLSDKKFRADGNTNLVLAVKLYAWSKIKATASK